MTTAIRPLTEINCLLGEGPVWSVAEKALYWIDIESPALHRWYWGASETQTWSLPALVGALAIRERGGLVLALRTGIHTFDLTSGELTFVADPEGELPGTRYNDGTVDPAGRFWIGGMVLTGEPRAAGMYRFSADGVAVKVLSGIGCANGAGFSPDGTVMYHTDSDTRTITRYEFDAATGDIRNPTVFVSDDDCTPDGLTVDAQGFVWSAKWDGSRIVRYAPDGSIDRVIPVPVQRPTSVTFGGPDLRTLIITTARNDLTPEELETQPLAGRLLVIDDAGVTGLPEPLTAL
jgi:L-arabinonolactonase